MLTFQPWLLSQERKLKMIITAIFSFQYRLSLELKSSVVAVGELVFSIVPTISNHHCHRSCHCLIIYDLYNIIDYHHHLSCCCWRVEFVWQIISLSSITDSHWFCLPFLHFIIFAFVCCYYIVRFISWLLVIYVLVLLCRCFCCCHYCLYVVIILSL